MEINLNQDWQQLLQTEFTKDYFKKLSHFVDHEYRTQKIHPDEKDIFAALNYTPYEKVKVVILGQDPYHGANQAQGLSFSVQPGVKIPPSLRNIYQELASDLKIPPASQGDLTPWAKQGVLLLNTVLTVREGQAYSHQKQGWEILTDRIIELLNQRPQPMVFILWGKGAQAKAKMIDRHKHLIITSPHPSPLSAHRGFFGSKPFSKTNQGLTQFGLEPIDWQLP